MERGFVGQQNARKRRVLSRVGYCITAVVIGAFAKRRLTPAAEGRANEPFFTDRQWSSNNRGLRSFRSMEEGNARRTKERGKSITLARSRSYGGNFQASGFPGNLWRGHSLDRHEQCSPSFIRPCYRSGPLGPAGVTRVIREHRAFTSEKEHVSSDGTLQA